MDSDGKDTDESPTMSRPEPGSSDPRSSSRSFDTSVNFKRSTESGRSVPGSSDPRSSARSLDTAVNFTRSTESGRPEAGSSNPRSSARSLDTSVNFKRSTESGSPTMSRPEPGSSDPRSSARSLDTSVNFKRSTESGSPTMSRPEAGSSDPRASSRSLDTSVNFKRSTESGRPEPGSSDPRASSRSFDTSVNFKRSTGSRRRQKFSTMSLRSSPNGSINSLDSIPEPWDHEERPRSPGSESLTNESIDLPPQFTFDPLNVSRMSDCSIEKPPSISGSDQFNPRSPSPAISRDTGYSGSTGHSAFSTSKEQRLPPLYAGPDDVACDMCSGRKLKAWKSCLTCVRSFCEMHGRDHYRCQEMELHQLVEVTKNLDVYKENSELKQMINVMKETNRALREQLNTLKRESSVPSLPAYICKGKTPTAADVILDPETAHRALTVSNNGKRVRMGQKSKVQRGPKRFDRWECVLAKNGFSSGRHYWQVEVNKEFTIGVMKGSAQRNGRFAFAPFQGYWCIFHFWLSFSALENHVVRLPNNAVPQVLGVCVDVDERWVTFYDVETKDQIYTFKDMKLVPGEVVYPIFRTVERSMDLQINTVR